MLINIADEFLFKVGGLTVTHACALLEFCLVTGLDWWDVLIALRPPLIETVCERFNDTFHRQLSAVQQFYYVRFLNIKVSLILFLYLLIQIFLL